MKIERLSLDSEFFVPDIKGCGHSKTYKGIQIFLNDGSVVRFGIEVGQDCCEDNERYGFDAGGYQAIRVVTSVGEFDCVVYNAHNGYYSHATIFNDTVDHL